MRETGGVLQRFYRLRKAALSGIEQAEVVPAGVGLLYREGLAKLLFRLLRLPCIGCNLRFDEMKCHVVGVDSLRAFPPLPRFCETSQLRVDRTRVRKLLISFCALTAAFEGKLL